MLHIITPSEDRQTLANLTEHSIHAQILVVTDANTANKFKLLELFDLPDQITQGLKHSSI